MRPDDWEWLDDAACRNMGPELFFPARGESAEPAKRVCASCPDDVVEACFLYSVRFGVREGVWGGQSEKQRRETRRDLGLRSDPTIPRGDRAALYPSDNPQTVRVRKYRSSKRSAS